ncbi:hypothetical protein B0H16DRAFT_1642062 [Mycena metata]|uniref:Uncharacterized protein n=1 Tax=Mycena metata TaxID=1033252 RepID=A0AAD7GPD3_9AGAR|nr:hypothetical protein B0H16DRAFT_1642062 [Mycena metata]
MSAHSSKCFGFRADGKELNEKLLTSSERVESPRTPFAPIFVFRVAECRSIYRQWEGVQSISCVLGYNLTILGIQNRRAVASEGTLRRGVQYQREVSLLWAHKSKLPGSIRVGRPRFESQRPTTFTNGRNDSLRRTPVDAEVSHPPTQLVSRGRFSNCSMQWSSHSSRGGPNDNSRPLVHAKRTVTQGLYVALECVSTSTFMHVVPGLHVSETS